MKQTNRTRVDFAWSLALCTLTLGCGREVPPTSPETSAQGSHPEQQSAARAPAAPANAPSTAAGIDDDAASQGPELSRDIPTECASEADVCVPPKAFAEQVCRGKFPDLAVLLFSKRMPWQRAYVKAEWLEPVNAYGGQQSERWLQFGEEVVLLKQHGGGASKVQVSGPADVDILRWDGTCATVRREMLVTYVPGQPVRPHIVWKYLDAELQEALLRDRAVKLASEKERDACRGSSVTHPQGACEKAMKRLTEAIVLAVRKDIELPEPEKRPEWAK